MMNCTTATAGVRQAEAFQSSGFAIARRCIRKVLLRYLRWRTASQLQQLDVRTLTEFGINPEAILSAMHGIEIGDMP
jgi:hypothetical protein